jgi:di/tricarboxylate transporter
MSAELISILVLVAMFVIATVLPINMGALAFAAAFLVGTFAGGMSSDQIFAGFPGEIFVTIVGITYLFALAKNNGTIQWLVDQAVRLVRGRLAVIPWIMFAAAATLTAIGAVSAASVAIVAPIALGFAAQYKINPLLMGLMVIQGATAGSFSPISVFGAIVHGVMNQNKLPDDSVALFLNSLVFNTLVAALVFVIFGGLKLLREGQVAPAGLGRPRMAGGSPELDTDRGTDTERRVVREGDRVQPSARAGERHDAERRTSRLTAYQAATIVGIIVLVVTSLAFDLNVGLVGITVAVVLALFAPQAQKEAAAQITWPVVLLITGVLTYVAVLQEIGTIDYVGNAVKNVGAPLLAAVLICYIGGVVSAFASSVGVLGATIPLAVPFLQAGEVGIIGLVSAIAIASTVVDVSPFSTNGALVLANAQNVDRDRFYKKLLGWGGVVVLAAPALAWLIFVVIGVT